MWPRLWPITNSSRQLTCKSRPFPLERTIGPGFGCKRPSPLFPFYWIRNGTLTVLTGWKARLGAPGVLAICFTMPKPGCTVEKPSAIEEMPINWAEILSWLGTADFSWPTPAETLSIGRPSGNCYKPFRNKVDAKAQRDKGGKQRKEKSLHLPTLCGLCVENTAIVRNLCHNYTP